MKYLIVFWIFIASCIRFKTVPQQVEADKNDSVITYHKAEPGVRKSSISVRDITPSNIVTYYETLIGTPYLYASSNPQQGFDCSGFITYVFNHFNIHVPRSSIDFTNAAPEVLIKDAKPGDLILFTGIDSSAHVVGHMGIIIANDSIQTLFIHASSGKANGVTITPVNDYYKSRFVKVIRISRQINNYFVMPYFIL